jgi:uncharacterized protein (TIGR02246 family)
MVAALALGSVMSLNPIYLTQDARKEIEALFKSWERLFQQRDASGISRLMHPSGYTVALDGSKWSFSKAYDEFKPWFFQIADTKCHITIESLTINGDEAVAWIKSETSYRTKDGKLHHSVGRMADTAKRFDNGWRFVYSQTLP